MELIIQVVNRRENSDENSPISMKSTMTVKTNPGDTGKVLRQKVSEFMLTPSERIRLIFAGTLITDAQELSHLEFGSTTTLHAIITAHQSTSSDSSTPSTPLSPERMPITRNAGNRAASFFVFCPSPDCGKVQKGKLRVRCSQCKSGSLLVQDDPSCWNDVLTPERLHGSCEANQCGNTYAEFFFKCSECSNAGRYRDQTVVPLPQIRPNLHKTECAVCGDTPPDTNIDFRCEPFPHSMCPECFVAYSERGLQHRQAFILHPNFGFTLPCPVIECPGCIQDPHHFRLLGRELYEKYKASGAEFNLLQNGGLFCPAPSCGNPFFIDDAPESIEVSGTGGNRLVLCPACSLTICRACKSSASDCICDARTPERSGLTNLTLPIRSDATERSSNQMSLSTIKEVCKNCPRCHVSTEKNGGCNHMHCVQCSFQWCWLCKELWTEDCQWEHWFV